ncbi:MAG: hypothetical protein OXL96_27070 [Candidatus Poribacteria bacterium]|nr:hypothetical protein [Candidatus Poribacteria bacterium]
MMLYPGYPIEAWTGDQLVSQEERFFVLDHATRFPYIKPYDDDYLDNEGFQERRVLFEGRFDGFRAEGLGFAYLFCDLALSILSESCWDSPLLKLEIEQLDPESEELGVHYETVRHVSRSRHLSEDHAIWIEERIRGTVRTGIELLQRARVLFPNLEFCRGARKQIEDSAASSMPLSSVLEQLFALEKLGNAWVQGEFNYRKIHNASPESPSTMSKYGDQRRFVCPDGRRRTFEWHLKSLPSPWRIHIWADSRQKKILIGYVGRHLPTATEPT